MIAEQSNFDVIVIGSGMGGMTTAAALSKVGHKVLVLEQAPFAGGLTHAFSREGFTWDVGLHYCGTFGHDQPGGKIRDLISVAEAAPAVRSASSRSSSTVTPGRRLIATSSIVFAVGAPIAADWTAHTSPHTR